VTQPWKRNVAEVHIRTLARRHGIAIRYLRGRNWMEDAESSESAQLVHIPHPNNARQYLVALHELGHLIGPVGVSTRDEHPDWSSDTFHLITEAAAWGWAVEHIHGDLDRSIAHLDFAKTVGYGFLTHCWAVAEHAQHG
jgi:hypothetical protein